MAKASDVSILAAVTSPGTGSHAQTQQAPKLFTLPPNDSVLAKIRFTPPAKHRTGRTVDDALLFGDLVWAFKFFAKHLRAALYCDVRRCSAVCYVPTRAVVVRSA
eukprot:1778832-Rhodomonas_salina.1